jgi:hypothetical protein
MSEAPKLAYTVHHKGRKYTAGKTLEELGPIAAEFPDHLWEGGKAPAKSAIPTDGPDGGVYAATPEIPRSALPGAGAGAGVSPELATILRIEGGDNTPTTDPEETGGPGAGDGTNTPPAKKAAPAAKKSTPAGQGS